MQLTFDQVFSTQLPFVYCFTNVFLMPVAVLLDDLFLELKIVRDKFWRCL